MRCLIRHFSWSRLAPLLLAGAMVVAGGAAGDVPGVHNFLQAGTNIFSGSQPDGDATFAALAKLGVKTIVSVDGAKPDVAGAARHGLRYIHLPVGYDGIPTNRVAELARVVATADGPFFVHCHHGKHRGPTAVALMCLAAGEWQTKQAEAFLQQAGTSPDYPGLYRAVREFSPPAPEVLAAVSTNFPAVAQTSSLVDAMVALDEHLERLRAVERAGWRPPPTHPDVQPAHEAMLLWEQLRETARLEDTAKRPADYRDLLAANERAADELRQALRADPVDPARAAAALKTVSRACLECHKRYRNE